VRLAQLQSHVAIQYLRVNLTILLFRIMSKLQMLCEDWRSLYSGTKEFCIDKRHERRYSLEKTILFMFIWDTMLASRDCDVMANTGRSYAH